MPAYIVCYDLVAVGQNYTCIIEKLESFPEHMRIQKSVWLIGSSSDIETITVDLERCMDGNDKLFVAELVGKTYWPTIGGGADERMKRVLRYP